MKATLISFGYKADLPVPDADEFFDVRAIRNPHSVPALRSSNGLDSKVQDYIASDPNTLMAMAIARLALKDGVRIAFGCYGGRHRSVAVAEMLARALREEGWRIDTRHTQLVDYKLLHG
jgi:UPF0042 nucleotide-binding protein